MATTTTAPRRPMDRTRKAALYAGLFYIGTFVFSIPALGLYDGVVNDPGFVHGAGTDQGVLWGGLIEVLTGLTGIGTAVALYPVLKRYGPSRAQGFVAGRTLEAAVIVAGVLSVLSVYTLRQDVLGGADTNGVTTTASALVALKDWSFLLGPGIMPAINALCFATILYQFRLVPRIIPTIGLIGAPLLLASSLVTLFGGWEQVTPISLLFTLPIAAWELSIGVYMIVKGFRSPTIPGVERLDDVPTAPAVLAHA